MHGGLIAYYVLFIIKGTHYASIMTSANIVIQIVPNMFLGLSSLVSFVLVIDCLRHVISGGFEVGKTNNVDKSDYIPLRNRI